MQKTTLTFLALNFLLLVNLTSSLAQSPAKRTPPPPVTVASGNGTYNYKGGRSTDDLTTVPIKIEGFLLGEVVIKLDLGKQCGGSTGFVKSDNSMFSGTLFLDPGGSIEFRAHLHEFKRAITKTTVSFDVNLGVRYGGNRFMAPPCSNSFSYTARMENYHRYVPPKPYPGTLGATDYYDFRYRDCIDRHPGIGAPGYYKDFGEKYFNRFMTDVYPKLTPAGQKFLTAVGKGLQQAIEDKLKLNPVEFAYLELNGLDFRKFAFKTHVDVYCDSGWGGLVISDESAIKSAIEMQDLMDHYDKVTFGKAWTAIITVLQVEKCAVSRHP